jgi:hypothetical protein
MDIGQLHGDERVKKLCREPWILRNEHGKALD